MSPFFKAFMANISFVCLYSAKSTWNRIKIIIFHFRYYFCRYSKNIQKITFPKCPLPKTAQHLKSCRLNWNICWDRSLTSPLALGFFSLPTFAHLPRGVLQHVLASSWVEKPDFHFWFPVPSLWCRNHVYGKSLLISE